MSVVFAYLIQMVLPALAGGMVWALTRPLRRWMRNRRGIRPGPGREGALLVLFLFTAGLLALTLTPSGFWRALLFEGRLPELPAPFQGGVNLVPFRESWKLYLYWVRHGQWSDLWVNFLGNIVMFIPFGFFSGLLSRRPRWWKAALVTAALSLFIEGFQLLVSRGTDVDDLILNTLGGLMGYWVFLLVRKHDPGLVGRCGKR